MGGTMAWQAYRMSGTALRLGSAAAMAIGLFGQPLHAQRIEPQVEAVADLPPEFQPRASARDVSAAALGWGAAGATLVARLSGGRIVPGPGDGDGSGSFRSQVTPTRGMLCYSLDVQNVGSPTHARINEGGRLKVGLSVLELSPPVSGRSAGCAAVPPALALSMVRRPWDYYIDVATTDYPQGAIRGQVGP
jgi:CHRD domain